MTGITNETEPYFKDGIWGWDGTQWRKLALVWGYTDRYYEEVENTNADAGVNVLVGTVVPTGEVWVVEGIYGTNDDKVVSMDPVMKASTDDFFLERKTISVAAAPVSWDAVRFVLKAGDKATMRLYACDAGNTIRCAFWGYKMAIAE